MGSVPVWNSDAHAKRDAFFKRDRGTIPRLASCYTQKGASRLFLRLGVIDS